MFLIIIMALIDAFVLSLMKYQHIYYNPYYFIIAFIFYGIQPIIFYYSLNNTNKGVGKLSINNVLWDLLSDISVTILAIFIFKESLTTCQMLGFILGMISIYLLQ